MNKNNKLFLFSKVFFFLTWVAFSGSYFGAYAEADGVYLPYSSSCGTDWNNYPATPASINHTCLSKRYCSDIKYSMVRVGGFDRCLNDSSCGADNDIKYAVESETEESITVANPCSPSVANGALVTVTANNGVVETAYKKIYKTVNGSKCEITVKAPVIFTGISVTLADGSTASNANRPAVFYFPTGHNSLSGSSQNCFLKSCANLTKEELEAIDYSTNFPTDSSGNLVYDGSTTSDYDSILLYKFCEPHQYTGTVSMSNGTKVKYYDPNIVEYDTEYVYCNEYDDEDALQYLWKSGDSFDNASNYECVLHQCPRASGLSLICSTNYDLFYKKTNSYLIKYEQYVLKNTSSDPLNNPLRDSNCIQISNCSKARYTTNLECTNESTLNTECDNYVGLDKDFTDITDPAAYGLSQQTSCTLSSGKYYCSKTYDCAVSTNGVCTESNEDEDTSIDETLSYFYRPVPPLPATEICPSGNNGKCETGRVIIKRTLRGITDFPLGEYQDPGNSGFGSWWQYSNEAGTDRIEPVKDYFQTDLSAVNRNNICATSDSDFKNFESYRKVVRAFWISTYYHYGKYYDGTWLLTKSGVLPHILPLCDESSLGIKGSGKVYMCGNAGDICGTPSWDSYYIKGYPTYGWQDSEANVAFVTATVCLRQKNILELGVCGDRECRVDCAFGVCGTEWCGNDKCITLTTTEGEDCNLEKINGDDSSDCAGTVSSLLGSSIRFRLQMIDRRVFAFMDVNTLGCALFNGYVGQMNNTRRDSTQDSYGTPGDNASTIGGTFKGKLDQYSLFDDNNLVDYNCDGKITDEDVFGEYLFGIWNCQSLVDYEEDQAKPEDERSGIGAPTMANSGLWCYQDEDGKTPKDRGEVHPYCKAYRINNGKNPDPGFISDSWITWDVVQYQGNNQQENTSFCNVGSLDNCRGFYGYSKENGQKSDVFMRELQAFKMDLPLSPRYFYKYATIENSPDIFLPLLIVYSFRKYGDVSYTIYANADPEDIVLDFFRPSIEVKYGDTVKQSTIGFGETETSGSADTTLDSGEVVTANYRFRKTSHLYPNPSARVCLYQILTSENEQEIKCLQRKNPAISNFVIKPHDVEIEVPTVNAYLHEEDLSGVITTLNLSDTEKFIPFYDNDDGIYGDDNKNLPGSSFAYGQNFPIFLSSSYCSKLYYSCIFIQKEYNEKVLLSTTKQEELNGLKSQLTVCDETIDKYCKDQNGGEKIVQKKTDGTYSIVKVKKNNTADGAYNQICVTKGFEDYQEYVKALPYFDNVAGKCVLDNNSKAKSECRKIGYYEFCNTVGDNGCECLDGTDNCSCGDYGCIREIDCSCSGDSCLTLPEACFLSGFNGNSSSLDSSGTPLYSCKCLSSTSSSSGTTIRKATPREMGLCSNLININFCDPIKYYNENKVYYDGGDGEVLSVIEDDYISNIWRTNQKVYGKYYIDNFGHAEFEKTTDCSGDLPSEFCLMTKKCHSTNASTKGQVCQSGESGCDCSEYLQYGSCNGFWKEKYNTKPLAKCSTTTDKFNQIYSKFELVDGTGCERYSCPTITDNESPTAEEILESVNATEDDANSINTEGKSNGFATWKKYKKGTYGMSSTDLEGGLENGHGDDLEQRNALYCLQGYAPAGSNLAIKNYMPVVNELGSKTLQTRIDRLIKNLIGYGIELSTYDSYGNEISAITNEDITNYEEFVAKSNYTARDHLPMRYCSQIGDWMTMNDIYNEYDVNPYYTTDSIFHNPGTGDNGFLAQSIISAYEIPTALENTYGNNIDYSKRFCERLYCQKITANDIGLLSVEDSEPESGAGLDYTFAESSTNGFGLDSTDVNYNNVAYPNNTTSWSKNTSCVSSRPSGNYNNYPEDPTNCSDTRGNFMINNIGTIWRHAGGATWEETPASRKVDFVDSISGACLESKNFYPYGVEFLPTFQAQYNTVDFSSSSAVNIKNISFKNGTANEVEPTRSCNKWGQWGEINNRCVATCEAVDVFRTNFGDNNSDSKLENHEISKFYKQPIYRANYIGNTVGGVGYGDVFTGGAKWPRSVVSGSSSYVVGECDATVGKDNAYSTFPTIYQQKGIQFMRNGADTTYDGAPYRKCLADGTWGPVINPCINFMTCPDINILNSDLFSTTISSLQTVVSLAGGSIVYPEGGLSSGVVPVSSNCSDNPSYESGVITKNCDITTGNWEDGFEEASCVLKSCGDVYYKIGSTYVVNYQKGTSNLYYPSDSGLSGAFGSYLGNNFTTSCPSGYYCNNCDSNKLTHTCSLDNANDAVWNRKGECVPAVCSFSSLSASGLTGRNTVTKPTISDRISGGNYFAKANETAYNATIYAAGTIGTGNVNITGVYGTSDYATSGVILQKAWACATGYYASNTNVNFTCSSNSITGPGTWSISPVETCIPIQCPAISPTSYVSNGVFAKTNGTCADETTSMTCPGAVYTLSSCNPNYTKVGDRTITCSSTGTWISSGSGWCAANCVNASLNTSAAYVRVTSQDTCYDSCSVSCEDCGDPVSNTVYSSGTASAVHGSYRYTGLLTNTVVAGGHTCYVEFIVRGLCYNGSFTNFCLSYKSAVSGSDGGGTCGGSCSNSWYPGTFCN